MATRTYTVKLPNGQTVTKQVAGTGTTATRTTTPTPAPVVSSPTRTSAVTAARTATPSTRTYTAALPGGGTKQVQVTGGGNQATRTSETQVNVGNIASITKGEAPGGVVTYQAKLINPEINPNTGKSSIRKEVTQAEYDAFFANRSNPASTASVAPGNTASQTSASTPATGQAATGTIPAATEQSSTSSANIFENPAFKEALTRIESSDKERTKMVEDIKKSMESNAANKKSVWDRLYGEDSKLSTFFSPALKNVEEQILDVEGLLESLKSDVDTSTQGVGITSAQRNRVLAKEQTGLTQQMSQLGRAYERLRAGYNDTLALADREFKALTDSAQEEVNAAIFELENSGMSQQESALIGSALNAQLQLDIQERIAEREAAQQTAKAEADTQAAEAKSKAETTKAVDKILSDALTFVQKAGAVPSDKFSKVVQDAHRMAQEGKSLGEIQAGVMAAVGSNPQVKKYMDTLFDQEVKQSKASSGGGSGGGSRIKLSATQRGQLAVYYPEHAGAVYVDEVPTDVAQKLFKNPEEEEENPFD